jgi:MFS family permease
VNIEARAEAKFQEEVAANLTRNYVSQLVHGMLAMTGFRLVNAPTFVPAYLFALSGSTGFVGIALAMQHLGSFASSIFGAAAVEHRRKIVDLGLRYGWSMRLSVLGLAIAGFLHLPPMLELALFALCLGALGVFSGMQNVLWNVLLTKTIPTDRRGTMLGLRNFLGGLTAAAVAYAGGEYLVEHNVLGNGYASTFLLAFVLTAAGLLMLYLVREPEAPTVRAPTGVRERLGDIPELLRDRDFSMYFWAQSLAMLGALALPFYVIFVGKALGLSLATDGVTIGALGSAFLASQTVASPLWGALADRMGFKAVFVPALVLWAASAGALLLANELTAFLLCFIAIGIGHSGFMLASQNMVLEFGQRSDLPLRIAMVNSAQSLVQAFGAIAGGQMADSLGFEVVFGAAVVAKLAAAFMLWFYVREPRENQRPRGEVVVDAGEGSDQ